jgi:heme/copper-type cytochrome/quinol oxidase subunit 2
MIDLGLIAMGIVLVPVAIICLGVIGWFFYKTWKIGRDNRRKV